ncbi:MAG: CGLD27 family protein [Cyanobacteria bacterium P01_H01_bin.119]
MKSTPIRCPVPDEQQPLNEYEEIKASWFYSWGHRPLKGYLLPIAILWGLSWIIVGPTVSVNFAPDRWLGQFGLVGTAGSFVVPTLALTQLYTGWRHVGDRLSKAAVPYEESGWYDGQVWVKPEGVANRDRLIHSYEIKPVLKRLHLTFAAIAGLLCAEGLIWQLI